MLLLSGFSKLLDKQRNAMAISYNQDVGRVGEIKRLPTLFYVYRKV
jgi:hypothetical protein